MRYIFVIWYHFVSQKGKKKVVQTAKHLCAVNGDGVMAESTVSKWFARFKIRNLWSENWKPSVSIGNEQTETLNKYNPDQTTRDITEIFQRCGYVRCGAFEKNVYMNHYNVWVLGDLTENNGQDFNLRFSFQT